MMFCVTQPPCRGTRPFAKDFFKIANLSIDTLIRTGFPSNKIIYLAPDEDHIAYMKRKFGIDARLCSFKINKSVRYWVNKKWQHLYFYKPLAFYNMVPEPIDDNTVMAFSDIDILWQKNPFDILINQSVDVWAHRGARLPRFSGRSPKRKRWESEDPNRTIGDLTAFYYKAGGAAFAELQLEYDIPLNRLLLYTGTVVIKPNVYKDLIALWHEMCFTYTEIAKSRKMPEIGDQEVFASAVWKLGLSHDRGGREVGGFIKHYGGLRKKEMIKDHEKYCIKIAKRFKQREMKAKENKVRMA